MSDISCPFDGWYPCKEEECGLWSEEGGCGLKHMYRLRRMLSKEVE